MPNLRYSVRFNLQQNKLKNKKTSLRCIVRFNNERVVFGTNIQIEPRFFNTKSQSVRNSAIFNGKEVTKEINKVADYVDGLFEGYESYPDTNEVERLCKSFIGTKDDEPKEVRDPSKTHLVAFFEDTVKKMKSGAKRIPKGKRRGQKYKDSSIKNYETVLVLFKKYAAYSKVEDFPFEDVNEKFYDSFQAYFYDVLRYSAGYFATVIKNLKSVMGDSLKGKLHTNDTFKSDHFVKPDYESDTIYLNVDQLDKINNSDLDLPHLIHARDVFLVGCWTGLRFSDFSTLTLEDIEDGFIRIMSEKMEERVTIPLHPVLKAVIERNGGDFPPPISNQKLNENIKIVARLSGLSKKHIVKKNKGGEDIYEEVNFCSLVTTHTARRSFATNMFKLGIPTLIIMAITGHTTEKSFLKYIRVNNEEKAQIMREMWKKLGW
ncbi:site-specific integrase [Albibacterium profundi]|uniref:Tyrosine-type recombinase/integrase n=1 Tax=Albibacterium profundi TaxID=3134906 RepID=A0ABV5CET5_9SPHI